VGPDPASLSLAEVSLGGWAKVRAMSVSSDGRADLLTVGLKESLDRVSALAAIALSTRNASVMFAGAHALPGMSGVLDADDQEGLFAQ
jgi:hypothetical protein